MTDIHCIAPACFGVLSAKPRNDDDVVMTHAGILGSGFECHGHHGQVPCIRPHERGPALGPESKEKVIMEVKLAVIAFGALVLVANGANAQHRTDNQTNVRHLSRIFGQAYGYGLQEARRYRSSVGVYESYSLGRQSYPNPDRGPYPTPVGAAYF
jgi:hypothetical protein